MKENMKRNIRTSIVFGIIMFIAANFLDLFEKQPVRWGFNLIIGVGVILLSFIVKMLITHFFKSE